MTLIVNLYGAPSAGKSTTASGLFYLLKLNGINAEYVTEVAKDFTWEKRQAVTLRCQPYVFGKQFRDVFRVMDQTAVAIVDSPLLLSAFYAWKFPDPKVATQALIDYIIEQSKLTGGINYLIKRTKSYNPMGRNQTEEESDIIARELEYFLQLHKVSYKQLNGDASAVDLIYKEVMDKL